MMIKEVEVIIVGAGPSGIATSVCLNHLSIPNIVLEREDCLASLWTKKSYDRLHLHKPKNFCELPYMAFPADYPTYMSKDQFIVYLENYAARFMINPLYNRLVDFASFDDSTKKWRVKVRNTGSDFEEYISRFLVVAAGRNSDPYVPEINGLDSFTGEVIHSTEYKSGERYANKNVMVVGAGNSGMEIALDLSIFGAKTSIVVRSPIHIISREMSRLGFMLMMMNFPINMVDWLLFFAGLVIFGDTTKYGIARPKEGVLLMHKKYQAFPVVDVGTFSKIKSGQIQVLPPIKRITGDNVEFANEKSHQFDVIVFATGFKRSVNKWLEDGEYILNENGSPNFSISWKGKNGLYCAGLTKTGLFAAAADARNIANDIKTQL
ncbi:hypothetical protein MKW94_010780 [Papaver nudicaule]|uniref:Flavin-containing monooxygenase n=1 Tax=Papaver nudicaule TaxID=74823 RepID=A0AA41VBB1_PAPNU|nr:hypothetical protein [Papaver nudicaule]